MNEELKKQVENCSRCGLCMEVCPVYKVKKTETSVLRGKFLQILGLIKGDLKFDKKISYNLDLCLACGKCKKACPSGVDAIKIFSYIKSKNFTLFDYLFYSAPSFKLKLLALRVMYKIKYAVKNKKKSKINSKKENENAVWFNGCATKAMGLKLGFPLFEKKETFSCCALPYYLKGRLDLYEKYKKRNLQIIKKYDKVVFNCATCYDTVLNYEGAEKEKLVYFTDYYKNKKLVSPYKMKITFHKPCHLSEEKFIEIEEILKNIENAEYERLENYGECCGFGGDFFTRHLNTAYELSNLKAENILKINPDIVLTTCPTCLWSLKFGIKSKKNKHTKASDLAEFLELMIRKDI